MRKAPGTPALLIRPTRMPIIEACLAANRAWAARTRAADPGYFDRLCRQQRPDLLWIGCSDSRLMPTEITGRAPGEVFVHRNIANQVVPGDANCHAVLGYALEVLGVREVVVCGHYGCGGVQAALEGKATGVLGLWIEHLRAVEAHHRAELEALDRAEARADRLAELNVLDQAANVARSASVREAWARGQPVRVHSWIYALRDGLLRPLAAPITRGA
jgi:carbonic anhydrase